MPGPMSKSSSKTWEFSFLQHKVAHTSFWCEDLKVTVQMIAVPLKMPLLRGQNFPSINSVTSGRGISFLKILSFLFDNMEFSSIVIFSEAWPEVRVVNGSLRASFPSVEHLLLI